MTRSKSKSYAFNVSNVYRKEREIGKYYTHKIAELITNDNNRHKEDFNLYPLILQKEESGPQIGKSYLSKTCYEDVKNMFSEFRGCYRNIERGYNVRKRRKPLNSTKKKKGIIESMNKFEKNLEEIQKVRDQWESQSKPVGIYKNIRKLDSTLCSLSGF